MATNLEKKDNIERSDDGRSLSEKNQDTNTESAKTLTEADVQKLIDATVSKLVSLAGAEQVDKTPPPQDTNKDDVNKEEIKKEKKEPIRF